VASNADVIIVGAGLVGLSFALALKEANCSVIIIDRQLPSFSHDHTSIDQRVSAISPGTANFFQTLGVWQSILDQRAGHYQKMHVWDSESAANITFNAFDVGQQHLGHIIENRVIKQALFTALSDCEQVSFLTSGEDLVIARSSTGVVLKSSKFASLNCHLLVGADGARSIVREACGFTLKRKSYQQKAIVTTVTTENAHKNTAYQRFLPTGPLAFLPLWAPNVSSIVWSAETAMADKLVLKNDKTFNTMLTKAFDSTLGQVRANSKRLAFPLYRQYATSYVKERVALIGDAAHTVHPLAGQGVNLGFLDARALAGAIQKAKQKQRPIHSVSLLKSYERERRLHNQLVMSLMDGFDHLFSTTNSSLTGLREAGVNMTDAFSPLKNYLIRQAMGV